MRGFSTSMTDRNKIKEMLGFNIPANVVASALGISDGLVSQLLSEEDFAKEVHELRIASSLQHVTRDKEYDSIEDTLIERLKERLENPLHFTKPSELLAAIRVINGAKRRSVPTELSGAGSGRTVLALQLPANTEFAARFVLNDKSQVVEVAGRPLATMGAKGVIAKLEQLHESRKDPAQAIHHKQDETEATNRLRSLVKMEELPVADLL